MCRQVFFTAFIILFNDVCHPAGMSMGCFMHWILAGPTFVSYGFNLEEGRSVLWSNNTRRSPFRLISWLGLPRLVLRATLFKFPASTRFCCMVYWHFSKHEYRSCSISLLPNWKNLWGLKERISTYQMAGRENSVSPFLSQCTKHQYHPVL